MNRIYKFRAWDKVHNSMKTSKSWCIGFDGKLWPNGHDEHKTDDFIIMQFTGLLDKNGKEIYEGDILQVVALHMKVVWDENKARYYLVEIGGGNFVETLIKKRVELYEIIGNIYENSELLK